jgi:hypothetical protein
MNSRGFHQSNSLAHKYSQRTCHGQWMNPVGQAGRLDNPRLVDALIKGLTNIIIGAIEAGRRDLATEAIEISRKMPIRIGRRVRLAIYQILSLLPQGVFPRAWLAWLKIRRTIFEIPKRE